MSWGRIILFAVLSGAAVAGLKLIPGLENTSFQDPAINPEFWLLCGIFISVNCKKWYEASLKTFVFFLISQPLIYLIQVPFYADGFGIFRYYDFWFKITLLTLPAAAIAFFLRKKNLLSALILSGGVMFCGYMAARYFWSVCARFPHHLISLLFCLGLSVYLIFTLLEKKNQRIALLLVLLLSFAVIAYVEKPTRWVTVNPGEGSWICTVENEDVAEVSEESDGSFRIKAKTEGHTSIYFTRVDSDEPAETYYVTVYNGSIMVNLL